MVAMNLIHRQFINFQSLFKHNLNLQIKHCVKHNRGYSMAVPENYLFTSKHEWVNTEKNIGTIGITNYAAELLGDIAYVQLPEVGTSVKANVACGILESVKAAADIFPPVSGTVTEVNVELESSPELITNDCFRDGWLFKVKLSDPGELDLLMSHEAYLEELERI